MNYTNPAELTLSTKDLAQRTNERYVDFLKSALNSVVEVAQFYENEAKKCQNHASKLFLHFLAGKKRAQYVILEMIVSNAGCKKQVSTSDYSITDLPEIPSMSLSSTGGDQIMSFAYSRAEKDLKLYKNLVVLEEDQSTRKLLSTLARLSKEYLHDVTVGFARFTFSWSERRTQIPQQCAAESREKILEETYA